MLKLTCYAIVGVLAIVGAMTIISEIISGGNTIRVFAPTKQ